MKIAFSMLLLVTACASSHSANQATRLLGDYSLVLRDCLRRSGQAKRAHLGTGSVKVKTLPFPTTLVAVRSPPIARANSRLIARPSPTPL